MRIIVLVKQVPDPHGFVGMKEDGTLDREKSKSIINAHDRNALVKALEIKEKDKDTKITIISMGPPKAEDVIRESLAMGADDGILVSDRKLAGSDTLATSYALAKAIGKVGDYDLVLCGVEATDGNTGQVGPEIAEHLNIPQMTFVESFVLSDDKASIIGKRIVEDGSEKLETKLPALITITESIAGEEERSEFETTFSGILRATKTQISKYSAEDINADEGKIGLSGSPTKLKNIKTVAIKRDKNMITGKDADEIVEKFVDKLKNELL